MLWTSIYVLPGLPSCFSSLGFRVAWPSCAQRWIFLLKPCWARRLDFFRAEIFSFECSVQKFSYFGVLCKNIGQVSLHVREGVKKTTFFWEISPKSFYPPNRTLCFLEIWENDRGNSGQKGRFSGWFFSKFPHFLGSWVAWAPKLPGLPSFLGSRVAWAPELHGLPSCLGSRGILGSRFNWAPKDHCTIFCCEQWKWKLGFFFNFSDSVALYDVE